MTRPLTDYERGWLACLDLYAYSSAAEWAEKGVQYVGSTGRTRREAVIEFLTKRHFTLEEAEEIAG